MNDMVSSLKTCLRWKEDEPPREWGRLEFVDTPPHAGRTPWGEGIWLKLSMPRQGRPTKGPWQPQSPWKRR